MKEIHQYAQNEFGCTHADTTRTQPRIRLASILPSIPGNNERMTHIGGRSGLEQCALRPLWSLQSTRTYMKPVSAYLITYLNVSNRFPQLRV